VLLRTLLLFLLGWVMFRALRGLFRLGQGMTPPASGPRETGRSASSSRLDPEGAVPARWSEVEEEGSDR
jgi:hypothetical protein